MSLVSRKNGPASQISDFSNLNASDSALVKIGTVTIPVEVAATASEIKAGLSGRTSLQASYGMLFLFDHDGIFKFWMKGMKFSIDMIWIDVNYEIVDITERVPIVPFLTRPIFYSPSVPARYVLEVNAGFCAANGIAVGDAVEFRSVPPIRSL